MVRKLTALVTMIVVAFALLPATAALAAPQGSAALAGAARNVFPTAAGATQPFTITVNNTGSTGGVLGLQGAGDPIKFITVTLPANTRNAVCGAAAEGWTCRAVNRSGQQPQVQYSTQGGGIAPGGNMPVTFSSEVVAPNVVSKTESFIVRISADGMDSQTASGDTSFTTHGLELLQGIVMTDSRETGTVIPDLRYTSGQIATAAFSVLNRSQATMTVAPTLTSSSRTATLVSGDTTLLPGETGTYTFTVDTGNPAVTSGRSLEDFDGKAKGTANGTTGDAVTITNGAVANFTRTQLQIEAPATLTLAPPSSVRVQGQQTRLAPYAPGVQVSIDATKANFPGVNLATGTVPSELTLTIENCTEPADPALGSCSTTAALADVDQQGSSIGTNLPRLNGGSANLTLEYIVNFTELTVLSGDRVNLDASFQFAGTDDNAFGFGPLNIDLDKLLVIDLAAPILELAAPVGELVADRVADGDDVTVSGRVIHTDDLAEMTVTLAATQNAQNFDLPADKRVDENTNRYREVIVTQDDLGPAYPCEAPYLGRTCQDISDVTVLPGEKNHEDGESTYAIGFGAGGLLNLSGSAKDTAGNSSIAVPAPDENGLPSVLALFVDNDHADITPKRPLVAGGSTVGMEALAFYIDDEFYGTEPVVRVTWDAGSYNDILEGGCTTQMWSVDDVTVTEVLYADGTPCVEGQGANPDNDRPITSTINDRILVLDGEIDPALETVNFSYVAAGGPLGLFRDPITDAVANEAYHQDGVVIDGRTPNLPVIDPTLVTRHAVVQNEGQPRESVGVSYDENGTSTDQSDDFPMLHTNVNDLEIPVTGFIPGTDDLEILAIDPATGAETQLARIPTQEGQSTLTLSQAEIQLDTSSGNARSYRAFRLIRVAETADSAGNVTTYDIPGLALRTDFVYDTGALVANSGALALGQGTNGADEITVTFGAQPNDANEIRFFYGSEDEWLGLRSINDGADGEAIYASHLAENVFNTATEVTFDIDYNGNDPQDFHAAAYEQWLGPDMGFYIEDLAGNLMPAAYRAAPDGTVTYPPY